MPKPAAEPEMTFEAALTELDAVVSAMESPKIPLEELISRYEHGLKLVKIAEDKLKAAEQRIEVIRRHQEGGTPETAPFDPASASTTPPAAAPSRKTKRASDDEVALF